MHADTHKLKHSKHPHSHMLHIHKHKIGHIKQFSTDTFGTTTTKKKTKWENRKSIKGTALHFVPGYISVGSIGFPELQLQISCPSDSSDLLHWTRWQNKEKQKEKHDTNTLTFLVLSSTTTWSLCTRCKESFYKLVASPCQLFGARNAYDANKPLSGKLRHKQL